MTEWKDNILFILVEPKEQGNIGAAARAIKNMGFKNLALVNPHTPISDEALWLAHNAEDVLQSASIHTSLSEAIEEKSLVVGTARRTGRRRGVIMSIEEGITRIREAAHSNKIAILFGREDRGLYNEEVEECGFLITIPTSRQHPSLNLAQAVLLIAYELSKSSAKSDEPFPALVEHRELLFLYERAAHLLKALEYIPRGNKDLEKKIMASLKHFIGRAGLAEWELKMLHGICTQIEKKLVKDGARK